MAASFVESGSVIVAGGAVTFQNTITKDGLTFDLTGKTVVATIRRMASPFTVIHATLEDLPVSLGGTTPAILGGVNVSLSPAQTELLAPPSYLLATTTFDYSLNYKVVTDSYYPSALVFSVRRKMD